MVNSDHNMCYLEWLAMVESRYWAVNGSYISLAMGCQEQTQQRVGEAAAIKSRGCCQQGPDWILAMGNYGELLNV